MPQDKHQTSYQVGQNTPAVALRRKELDEATKSGTAKNFRDAQNNLKRAIAQAEKDNPTNVGPGVVIQKTRSQRLRSLQEQARKGRADRKKAFAELRKEP